LPGCHKRPGYTGRIVYTRDRCHIDEKTEEIGIIAEVERKCITN
jgi:hypothetical protein